MMFLEFYHVFTSHMVLQRRKKVSFSGWGAPQHPIEITFADTTRTVEADADGQWRIFFPPREAGGPYTVTAKDAITGECVVLDDVMVGEVWFCAGQSNMEMPIDSDNPFFRIANPAGERSRAEQPQLRIFNATFPRRISPYYPVTDYNGRGWRRCDGDSIADFSACAYFFGRKLLEDLKVPVGIIAAAWGGTDIEAWISAATLREFDWMPPTASTESAVAGWQAELQKDSYASLREWMTRFDQQGTTPSQWLKEDFDDSAWEEHSCKFLEFPVPGRYLVRIHFNVPEMWRNRVCRLEFGFLNDADRTWCNGSFVGSTGVETPEYWAMPRSYELAAGLLATENCVAVELDNHCGTGYIASMSVVLTADGETLALPAKVRSQRVFALPPEFPPRPAMPTLGYTCSPFSANYPSTLFQSMLSPWFRYPVAGFAWYQGCNNNGQFSYYLLHQLLIDDVRRHWNDPELPFLLVQLAAFHDHRPEQRYEDAAIDELEFPEFSAYALTREIQAELPHVRSHVGVICAFDCGDHSDIHPRDKQTVGERLAAQAERMPPSGTGLAAGPVFAGFRREGERFRLYFHNIGSGLTTVDGKAPVGFALGDRTGRLFKATAEIDGDTVVLFCPEVTDPQRVRYAFTGCCRVNLINREGFPAFPFRSDKPDYAAMFCQYQTPETEAPHV